jgi:hypothetical protein
VAVSGHKWNISPTHLNMTAELQKYLLEHCREWMLPEEIKALTRISLTKYGEELDRKIALTEPKMESFYGFRDEKTNQLVELGKEKLEISIAERLLKDSADKVINNCPKCGKLARTPRAKQCRHCKHDWH